MESTSEVIQRLVEASPRSKEEPLTRLRAMAENRGSKLIIANAKGLFNELRKLIENVDELKVSAIDLVTIFVQTSNDPDIIAQLSTLYPFLISALRETDVLVLNSLRTCLFNCITKSISIDSFLLAIKNDGVCSEDKAVRKKASELLIYLAKECPQFLSKPKHGTQVVDILEVFLGNLEEFGSAVVLFTQSHPSVHRFSSQLPFGLKRRYDSLLLEKNILIDTNYPNAYEELDAAIEATIDKSQHIRRKSEYSYGVVPNRLMADLLPTSNWKKRVGAIEELEELLAHHNPALQPHTPAFIQYLVTLLNDPNYRVVVTCLQIINRVLKTCHCSPSAVLPLVAGLVEKVGDNKVTIRQLAIAGLRLVGGIVDPVALLNEVLEYVNSPKWHTREEVLNFIIISFIDNADNSFSSRVSYPELISSIAPLLKDDKPKVVQIAFEACATIAKLGNYEKVMRALEDNFEEQEISAKLAYRIKAGAIPVLNSDGTLEFPYISKQLITQNTFYTGTQRFTV